MNEDDVANGERVAPRSNPAQVGTVLWWQPPYAKVYLRPGVTRMYDIADLIRVDTPNPDPLEDAVLGRYYSPQQLWAYITALRVRLALSDHVYAFRTGKIDYYPHQYRPLIRLIHSDSRRLLVADEVGLGKTIEAGLIHRELAVRGEVASVLVLCPATLRLKWQTEMRTRFAEEFDLWRRHELMRYLGELESGAPADRKLAIISMQSARHPDVAAKLRELTEIGIHAFDLVVIDEAHHMRNADKQTFQLGEALAAAASYVVMLSATPVNLADRDLFNQLHILAPEEYPDEWSFQRQNLPGAAVRLAAGRIANDEPASAILAEITAAQSGSAASAGNPMLEMVTGLLRQQATTPTGKLSPEQRAQILSWLRELDPLASIVTRTRKREVRIDTMRVPYDVVVALSSTEQAALDAIEWEAAQMRGDVETGGVFRAIQLERMACSCLPQTVGRLLGGEVSYADDLADELRDLLDDEDDEFSVGGVDSASVPAALGCDSKLIGLIGIIGQIRALGIAKAILFTSFRRTLNYLKAALARHVECHSIDGDTPMDERPSVLEQFKAAKADRFALLLMTEVGSEGLDFQFCSCLVNYDLPWNPMKIEQRIGRLDRLGQVEQKIHIFNLYVGGSIEDTIFRRLWSRIRIFERSIGPLESILSAQWEPLHRSACSRKLSEAQLHEFEQRVELAEKARKLEDELIDKHGRELVTLGDGDAQAVSRVQQFRRFVEPLDLATLLRLGVAAHFPGSHFEPRRRHLRQTYADHAQGIGATLALDSELRQAIADIPSTRGESRIRRAQRQWCSEGGLVELVQHADDFHDDPHLVDAGHVAVHAVAKAVQDAAVKWWCGRFRVPATAELPAGEYRLVVAVARICVRGPGEAAPLPVESYLRAAIAPAGSRAILAGPSADFLNLIRSGGALVQTARKIDRSEFEALEFELARQIDGELQPRKALRQTRAAQRLQVARDRHQRAAERIAATAAKLDGEGKVKGAALQRGRVAAAQMRFERLQLRLELEMQVQIERETVAVAVVEAG